jgi:hypothetical protein
MAIADHLADSGSGTTTTIQDKSPLIQQSLDVTLRQYVPIRERIRPTQ